MLTWIISICLLILPSGCTVTYKAVVNYENSKDLLIGTIDNNTYQGSASFQFRSISTSLTCEGIAERPYYIPSAWTIKGQRGRGFGKCSDGRDLKFEYETDEYGAYGRGKDSLGNFFYFISGLNDEEVTDCINKLRSGMSEEQAKNYIGDTRLKKFLKN